MVRVPAQQDAITGAHIRALRQRRGWSRAEPGELTGWHGASAVCAAEGRRDGRQRAFPAGGTGRLAAIVGISPRQLTTRCANCGAHPYIGSACLACGATPGTSQPALNRRPARHGHAAAHR
jgi:hypothetical protein